MLYNLWDINVRIAVRQSLIQYPNREHYLDYRFQHVCRCYDEGKILSKWRREEISTVDRDKDEIFEMLAKVRPTSVRRVARRSGFRNSQYIVFWKGTSCIHIMCNECKLQALTRGLWQKGAILPRNDMS